jgi:hypothetical protein
VTHASQFPADQHFPGSGPDGDGLPPAEDLFSTRPAASPQDIKDAALASMGLGPNPRPRPAGYPDVHQLAEDLGLA